jgi:hypothetical protein
MLVAFRQKLHLPACPNLPSHLCAASGQNGFS